MFLLPLLILLNLSKRPVLSHPLLLKLGKVHEGHILPKHIHTLMHLAPQTSQLQQLAYDVYPSLLKHSTRVMLKPPQQSVLLLLLVQQQGVGGRSVA